MRVLLAGLLVIGTPAVAAAAPTLHAHRGAALRDGVPSTPEDTLEAFADTARTPDVWLEMDTVVTADGVPVVIHDSTLDRTTDCTGAVPDRTAAFVAACRVDVLGVSGKLVPALPTAAPVRVPLLSEALRLAKRASAPVNLEIKRIPGDPGYIVGDRVFATRVMDVVKAARLDPAKLIMQSFDPTNLDVAREELPGVQTSLLTLEPSNEAAPELATARGYDWVSPGGVPSAAFVARAHLLGRKVIPYTLDTVEEVSAAAAVGVDAIITDDLPRARRALGLPEGPPPLAEEPPAPTPVATAPRLRRVTVRIVRRSPRGAARRGGVPVVLRAAGPARARLTVRLGGRTVARQTVRLRGAGARRVLLRLSPGARRLLRNRSRARLQVRIAIDGRPATRRTVTLR